MNGEEGTHFRFRILLGQHCECDDEGCWPRVVRRCFASFGYEAQS